MSNQEIEPPIETTEQTHDYVIQILPAGLMPGCIISSETIKKAEEAELRFQERRQERKDKKKKPPKPPRRPNARVGGVALGHGFSGV